MYLWNSQVLSVHEFFFKPGRVLPGGQGFFIVIFCSGVYLQNKCLLFFTVFLLKLSFCLHNLLYLTFV